MITQIRLRNFKSFQADKATEVNLRPLSVFVGPNGAGKSSILQALLVWAQSNNKPGLHTTGDFVDLGGPKDVGQSRLGLTIRDNVRFTLEGSDQDDRLLGAINADIGARPKLDFHFESETIGPIDAFVDGNTQMLSRTEANFAHQKVGLSITSAITSPVRVTSIPAGLERFSLEVGHALSIIERQLDTLRFVPALRGISSARYPLGEDSGQEISGRSVNENADALTSTLTYNNDLRLQMGEVVADITGVTLDRDISPGKMVAITTRRQGSQSPPSGVLLANEGFGTNQLVHLIAQVLMTAPGGVIVIEEPEIHLHPHAQARLGNWLGQHTSNARKQLLVATHSENFLISLLRLVRHKTLAPTELAVFYCSLDQSGHTSVAKRDPTNGGLLEGRFRDFFPAREDFPDWGEDTDWLKGLDT